MHISSIITPIVLLDQLRQGRQYTIQDVEIIALMKVEVEVQNRLGFVRKLI